MAVQIQLRRGTSAQHTSFTGANGELTYDSSFNAVRVHDGTTAGGYLHALANNGALVNPTITNFTETTYTANSGTSITLSLANGTVQIITLTGNCTITLPAVAAGKSFTVWLRMGTGGYSVTWASGGVHYWPGNITPTITGTANRTDVFSFVSNGTYWFATVVGQNYYV